MSSLRCFQTWRREYRFSCFKVMLDTTWWWPGPERTEYVQHSLNRATVAEIESTVCPQENPGHKWELGSVLGRTFEEWQAGLEI